jgi:signal transduction histidine kinase
MSWVVAFGLVTLAFLGPPSVLLAAMRPWDARHENDYPLLVRLLWLAVGIGVGLAGLLGAGLLGAAARQTGWVFGHKQLRQRSGFLFVAACVALGVANWTVPECCEVLSDAWRGMPMALLLVAIYALIWSITPTILRLAQARSFTLAVITFLSIAGGAGFGVALWLNLQEGARFFDPQLSTLALWMLTLGLATVGVAGIAVSAAGLIIRATPYLGGLSTRLGVLGFITALPVAWLQYVVSSVFLSPGSVPWLDGAFLISLPFLPLTVVVPAAVIHRLSRDLSTARAHFQAIVAGQLPRPEAVAGREESSRLLERLAHFSGQLSKRPFLEQLSAELRARAEQLSVATRRLRDTNSDRVQAERFGAIAGIVATASHELRNPVAQIAGNLPLIRSYVEATARNLRSPEELRGDGAHRLAKTAHRLSASGRDVEDSARRASLVMADLNAISATPLRALEEVDLREVVERSVRLTPRSPEIRVQCDLEPVPVFTARAGELEQVVVNLLENARDAAAPAGTVLARLRATRDSLLLEVEDDGPGMAPDVLARATEPFFTTKPPGEGTGLGLAIVSSIVTSHGGTLRIVSTSGSGTQVTVTLPLGEAAKPATSFGDGGGNEGRPVAD